MKKLNGYHSIGLILISIYLLSGHTGNIPHFVKGCIFGVGVGLTLLGIYAYNHDITKIKNLKNRLFAKVVGTGVK